MLESATQLRYLELEQEQNPLQSNWEELRTDLLDLTDFRIKTSKEQWYQEAYMYFKLGIEDFTPRFPSDVNMLPKGLVAEVFFLDACRKQGIECVPSLGEEDVLGADFRITKEKETRFFDVTVNTSHRGFMRKVKEGRFPTLFLPWKEEESNNGYRRSYAESFLRNGNYNHKDYLSNILSSNYFILDKLRRSFWRNQEVKDEILGKSGHDFTRAGILYIRNLDGVLSLIRRSVR